MYLTVEPWAHWTIFYRYIIVADPRQWTEYHVAHWLKWAIREFSLEGVPLDQFYMRGKDILAMGKETFLAKAPPFVGDILWEHLEMLQKGKCLLLQIENSHC